MYQIEDFMEETVGRRWRTLVAMLWLTASRATQCCSDGARQTSCRSGHSSAPVALMHAACLIVPSHLMPQVVAKFNQATRGFQNAVRAGECSSFCTRMNGRVNTRHMLARLAHSRAAAQALSERGFSLMPWGADEGSLRPASVR